MILTFALVFIADLNSFGRPNRLDVASLDASGGLHPLDTSVRWIALNAFARLKALGALARLDSFVGLDSLRTFYTRDTSSTGAGLYPLNGLAGLDALDTSRADVTELLLKVCICEPDVAVMRRIELPVLELTATSNVDSIKSAVKSGVGLDRCVARVTPIVVVPQGRADKERRAEPECGPDCPPTRIPEERYICRRPIIGTVDDHRVIDRYIDVIRIDRLDRDVLERSCIARTWRRGDPADLLLLA